jgi:hypothetical protein
MSEGAADFCGLSCASDETLDIVSLAYDGESELVFSGFETKSIARALNALELCELMGCAHHRSRDVRNALRVFLADEEEADQRERELDRACSCGDVCGSCTPGVEVWI